VVYLDNASTSFPKPRPVAKDMLQYMETVGASPGRGSYPRAATAEAMLTETRQLLASLLGTARSESLAFTLNATHGLNTLIKGLHRPGTAIVVSAYEHNSVLRPCYRLAAETGARVEVVPLGDDGLTVERFEAALRQADVGLAVCTHASNVTGRITPLAGIAACARRLGVPMVADLSQSAGAIEVALDDWGIDFAAGTGHKALLGPQGVGFVFARDPDRVSTLVEGGAGGHSLSPYHPQRGPEKFEAGTPNMVGIAGLRAALVDRAAKQDLYRQRRARENALAERLAAALGELNTVSLYEPFQASSHVPIISFNIEKALPGHVSYLLATRYDISSRSGLHCAPLAHKQFGTYPTGSVRLSLGPFVELDDLRDVCAALKAISTELAA